jgi:hypothetical protein
MCYLSIYSNIKLSNTSQVPYWLQPFPTTYSVPFHWDPAGYTGPAALSVWATAMCLPPSTSPPYTHTPALLYLHVLTSSNLPTRQPYCLHHVMRGRVMNLKVDNLVVTFRFSHYFSIRPSMALCGSQHLSQLSFLISTDQAQSHLPC